MAKQKPKRYYTRTIDLLFLLVFLIVSYVILLHSIYVRHPSGKMDNGCRWYLAAYFPYIIYAVHEEASQMGGYRKASIYHSVNGDDWNRRIFPG